MLSVIPMLTILPSNLKKTKGNQNMLLQIINQTPKKAVREEMRCQERYKTYQQNSRMAKVSSSVSVTS